MAAPKNAFHLWSQYLAARSAAAVAACFDPDANERTAQAVGRLMYRFDERHRKRAAASVSRCFPHWSAEEVERCVLASMQHLVQLAFEVNHTPRCLTPQAWPGRITLDPSIQPALALLNQRRPVMLLTGHLGNWELLGYTLSLLGYRFSAVARPLDNRLISKWVFDFREKRGLRILTKWDVSDELQRTLDNGGSLGFTADQNAGDKGVFVPFFGKLASSYKSIGLLAMQAKCPIVVGYAHRIGNDFQYRLGCTDVFGPEDWEDQPDPLYYITARYNRAIERAIRLEPAQFLWMHRRWKSRPKHEREGKPMPDRLAQKLHGLPWMTKDLFEQCSQPLDRSVANPT